jgi:glycosyltransferase involved in cell wall biosynthesis
MSHFIQYKVPLFQRLAEIPDIDLTVYYYSDMGLVEKTDSDDIHAFKWDTPLTEGYRFKVLQNWLNEENWKLHNIRPYFNPAIISEIIRNKYDFIMIHSYQYPSDWLALIGGKIVRKKIFFYGDLYPPVNPSILRKIYRKIIHHSMVKSVDACLAIGSVAESVYRNEFTIPSKKIFMVPYAVDNKFFQIQCEHWKINKDIIKKEMGIDDDELIVLCVARMVPKKRHKDLIDAMARQSKKARLMLIGNGPMMDEISIYCHQKLPKTILTGFINQTELPKFYAIADIFVLPSEYEEYGLVLNEAMNCGLPIIATQGVASTYDLLYDHRNGYTFQSGDIDTLSILLGSLLSSKELRVEFGKKSIEIINLWSFKETIAGLNTAIHSFI